MRGDGGTAWGVALCEVVHAEVVARKLFARIERTAAPRSGDDVLHHCACHIGEAEIAAAVAIRQPRVIQTHQMQHRRMEVMSVNGILHRLEAELVRGAVRSAAAHAASREQIADSRDDCDRGHSAPSLCRSPQPRAYARTRRRS